MNKTSDLETFSDESNTDETLLNTRIGTIIDGSLSKGLTVKLDSGEVPGSMIEQIAVGRYVVVQGLTNTRFFCIVTDVALAHNNPYIETNPPDTNDKYSIEIYRSTLSYGIVNIAPMLVLEKNDKKPKPVKTIPTHFSIVSQANEEDVTQIFGKADENHFYLGNPLEMDQVPINVNLDRFIERSSGVFGKSGTGKSFITRTLLSGIVKSRKASCLIFDMHNDYGWGIQNEHGQTYKGLQQLFDSNHINVITLDKKTSLARGDRADGELYISYDAIEPEDIAMLAGVLALSDVQVNALYFLRRRLGKDWFKKLLSDQEQDQNELDEFIEQGDLIKSSLGAIQRKFELFRNMKFLKAHVSEDFIEILFQKLNSGTSIVLEFGTYDNSLAAYMFVANYLTRRIHERYVSAKNKAFGKRGEDPNPLMIVIEEAHKFLTPELSQHTIFGIIARELRKYNVTLLVVDQRPSGIDDEVMSQIGTRVTCLLDNESDIRAVFSGVSGAGALREVLARLDTQQQALIMGHAVPMPVVIRTREYGPKLYAEINQQTSSSQTAKHKAEQAKTDLFG
tara:strand:+ start:550 stop:2241 length:1692 start_codon:yes stop_codon:yes gene_type:complete